MFLIDKLILCNINNLNVYFNMSKIQYKWIVQYCLVRMIDNPDL